LSPSWPQRAGVAEAAPSGGLDAASQRRMVDALRRALGAQLIETHISDVLIAGHDAWKIKKALDLGFADFSTLALRRFYCEEELRLNRRTAPQLYLDVQPVTGTIDAPSIGGPGAAIDWVLHMRAFDQDGLWDRLAARGALGAEQVDALVEALCVLHRDAAVAAADSRYGRPEHVRAPMSDNLQVLGTLCSDADERAWLDGLRQWEAQAFASLREVFEQRHAAGRVREAHGDLHLGNVTQIDGRPVLFDCLEFSADLRWTDVFSDVGFMAMDLRSHGLAALAHRFVNAYVERSGDADGLRVLRYYQVHRALVRAKVAAMRSAQLADAAAQPERQALHRYLQVALDSSLAAPAVATAIMVEVMLVVAVVEQVGQVVTLTVPAVSAGNTPFQALPPTMRVVAAGQVTARLCSVVAGGRGRSTALPIRVAAARGARILQPAPAARAS